jgi:hypothetical protein
MDSARQFFLKDKLMAKEKTKNEELSALGKQNVAHTYSAMDYYFDNSHVTPTTSLSVAAIGSI